MVKLRTEPKSEPEARHAMPMTVMNHDVLARNLPERVAPMTFANMVKASRVFPTFEKALPWLYLKVCKRKDHTALSDTEKARFICAYNMLNTDGTLGQLVQTHHGMYGQHSDDRLLPWHRVFLHLLEEALHQYHPDVCIPYWDWTKPEEQEFPDWLEDVLPTVNTPTGPITVIRSPGSGSQLASIASITPLAMSKTSYGEFAGLINGIHGSVHGWVGGTMSSPVTSPADPVFWLHHANLDRLWWQWYKSPQGNHQNPVLPDPMLHPWTFVESDVRNIANLEYTYI